MTAMEDLNYCRWLDPWREFPVTEDNVEMLSDLHTETKYTYAYGRLYRSSEDLL